MPDRPSYFMYRPDVSADIIHRAFQRVIPIDRTDPHGPAHVVCYATNGSEGTALPPLAQIAPADEAFGDAF